MQMEHAVAVYDYLQCKTKDLWGICVKYDNKYARL